MSARRGDCRRLSSPWQALANVLLLRVVVIYVPSVYINLSAALLAGLFQPGCLLHRLGDFSCLWDPEWGPAARLCQVPVPDQQQQAAPWSRRPLSQSCRQSLRPRGPCGARIPCGPVCPGDRRARRLLKTRCWVVSPLPWLSYQVLFCCCCDNSKGYLLFAAPLRLFSHPFSSAPRGRKQPSLVVDKYFPLDCKFWWPAGMTIPAHWFGGRLTCRYSAINGKFALSLRRQVSTSDNRQAWRHRLESSSGHALFPIKQGIPLSTM